MNRFSSSFLRVPVGLLLLSCASCKGPSSEASEPPRFDSGTEFSLEPEPGVTTYSEDFVASPPPAPASSSAATGSSATAQGHESTSAERLDTALEKDADSKAWGVTPYMQAREASKPAVRDNYVFLLGGARSLDDDAWKPVENPGTGGINYLGRGPGGWFHWDVAFSYGSENGNVFDGTSNVSIESTVWELDLGVTKVFALGSVLRPYIGVGATYLRAGGQVFTSGGPIDDSDNSFGGYGRVGLAFDISDWGGLIGIDARYVGGTSVSFGSVETDADGFVGSITFGYSW